MKQVDLDTDV